MGIVARSAALPKSPAIRIGRLRQPVDPDARGQREEDERQELERPEQRDLEGARVENEDRDEADREIVDLRPELADRLRRPELQEVAVPPEPAASARA